MKQAIFCTTILIAILSFSACKKCYNCQQYCAYCESKVNTGIVYKVCAEGTNSYNRVDSVRLSFPDSAYNCVKLTDNTDVCDNKNAVDDAYAYYQKQEYFCVEITQ